MMMMMITMKFCETLTEICTILRSLGIAGKRTTKPIRPCHVNLILPIAHERDAIYHGEIAVAQTVISRRHSGQTEATVIVHAIWRNQVSVSICPRKEIRRPHGQSSTCTRRASTTEDRSATLCRYCPFLQ